MDHSQLQKKLDAFYDGELPESERTILAAHTAQCSECRDQLAAWAQTRVEILAPLRVSASDVFVQAVMRRVRNLATERAPFFVRWALPALAFSAVSFAASLLYVLQPASASPEALLWADHSTNLSAQWMAEHPTEDQILSSVVTTR